MASAILDRELKKGSAELLILSLVEDRPRHGYEVGQLIELRSGREGHPSYRAVAHEMHAQIAAVHPAVAGAMTYVDIEAEPRLERILAEMRNQARAGTGS